MARWCYNPCHGGSPGVSRHGRAAIAGELQQLQEVAVWQTLVEREEAGGAAVRETHPSGTVVMSRCVAGRCSAVPLLPEGGRLGTANHAGRRSPSAACRRAGRAASAIDAGARTCGARMISSPIAC